MIGPIVFIAPEFPSMIQLIAPRATLLVKSVAVIELEGPSPSSSIPPATETIMPIDQEV